MLDLNPSMLNFVEQEIQLEPELQKKVDLLSFNLQERLHPYFTQEELIQLLELYKDINEASYEGCLMKAEVDGGAFGPLVVSDGSAYWIRRANHFRRKVAKYSNATGNLKRADAIHKQRTPLG